MKLFNVDGSVMRGLTKVTDCICLSLMFVICCLPVFTIGTAATALYYTVYKVIKNDRGYIFREYVSAFRNNFKQTTPVWLLVLVLGTVLGLDIYVMNRYAQAGSKLGVLVVFFLVAAAFLLAWALYLFAYMARFENTRKQSMKNALLMMLVHLPWTLALIVLAVGASFIMYLIPIGGLIVPGFFVWLESTILDKIFWKYMTDEDREAELERNREYKN